MPWRRILSMFTAHPHVIESLSETKLMRRAAQIAVGVYHRFSAGLYEQQLFPKKRVKFLDSFKEELNKEHVQMKKNGKL